MTQPEGLPHKITGSYGEAWISRAESCDLPEALALFDESVAWLVARGQEAQWGTTPFSQLPRAHERFTGWIEAGALFVARTGEKMVGVIALSDTVPKYVLHLFESFPDTAFYLEAFTTSRSYVGQGIGRDLLCWAEEYALQHGRTTIWLDCWAGKPALPNYYQGAGYAPRRTFKVGEWQGLLLEKKL